MMGTMKLLPPSALYPCLVALFVLLSGNVLCTAGKPSLRGSAKFSDKYGVGAATDGHVSALNGTSCAGGDCSFLETGPPGADSGASPGAPRAALIVVDVQKCFTENGGSPACDALRLGKAGDTLNGEGDRSLAEPFWCGLQNPKGDDSYKEKVIKVVEGFLKNRPNGVIALLQDFHPVNHVSFARSIDADRKVELLNKEGLTPLRMCKRAMDVDNRKARISKKDAAVMSDAEWVEAEKELLARLPGEGKGGGDRTHCDINDDSEGPILQQKLFPGHCLMDSGEALHIDDLCALAGGIIQEQSCVPSQNPWARADGEKHGNLYVVRKGWHMEHDSLGGVYDDRGLEDKGFRGNGEGNTEFEKYSNGLAEWLEHKGVKEVFLMGIADDFCVKATAAGLRDAEVLNEIAPKLQLDKVTHLRDVSFGIFAEPRTETTQKDLELATEYETKLRVDLSSAAEQGFLDPA
ncbi:unnamed protein product [Amoebophrya sp. A25]|nr:unnamed protein product [Amoebophrya sp. A25]|eukprot:GSA25T00014538001.1